VRSRHLNENDRVEFIEALRKALEPRGFDVLPEDDHIHVEYDPKQGEPLYGIGEESEVT
jgi:hypothetical protein